MSRGSPVLWPLAALAAVLVFNLLLTPGFFSIEMLDGRLYGSLVDVLNRAVPVLLLGLGMTLVIGTGGIDLSVGAVMAVAGSVAAVLIVRPDGVALPAIVGLALAAALVCGLFNGFLVAWVGIQPIVATLLLMVAGRGVAQLLANGQIVTFQHDGFAALGSGATAGIPHPIWLFAGALAIVAVLARGTAFGSFVEAVGSNPTASRLSGLDARTVKLAVYAICGVCAGLAGIIGAADIRAADANNAGLYLELDAILAVSVGGTALSGGRFTLLGTVVGAVLMQALTTTILTRGVTPEATLVLKAVVVVAVCLLQSQRWTRRAVAT